ncbi:MAG: hypothetical protein A2148_03045 [Chloroflexi bacterium RBG_16_68_14]|nr:MAG: hypothetical protein A2148_03045 [Chloroflexi bacterium RBG_16_68_14]
MVSIFKKPIPLASAVLAAFVVAVLVAGFAAGGFSLAQEDEATPTVEAGETPAVDEKESLREEFLSRLAENLGISVEKLEQALSQTALGLVDQALADGRITEEKATELRERIESGEGPLFPHLRPHPGPHHRGVGVVRQVAEFLGLEPQEVFEALKSGQSLAQIADAQGSSADKLKAFLLSELEQYLAQAVEKGRITQEQADQKLEDSTARLDDLIDSTGGPGFGGPWWPHGPKEDEATPSGTSL